VTVAIEVEIPGRGRLSVANLLLDINGTLSDRGVLIETVALRLQKLAEALTVHLLSADTFGTAEQIARQAGGRFHRVRDGAAKLDHVDRLGAEACVAIGNGTNDVLMLERSALGIVVLGPEGASGSALRVADVVCRSIDEALDLLLSPRALVATLRA
jgi:soluble P-type ATPase